MDNKEVCVKCNKKLKANFKNCPYCGEKIDFTNIVYEKNNLNKKKLFFFMGFIIIIVFFGVIFVWSNRCKHDYTDATCLQLATCKKCGITKGELAEHKWADANCEESETCLVCNMTKGQPLGHEWIDATCTTPKTCNRCLKEEGKKLGHIYVGQTCTEDGKCKRCGEISKSSGHKWKDATCTTAKKCEVCGIEEGSPLGHTGDEVCSRCGYLNKEVAITNAKNSIYIYGIDLDMNSVGGVDTVITWKNMSQKSIKYINFYAQYYNNVKDVISDIISDKSIIVLSSTGPFPYGKGNYDSYTSSSDGSAEGYYFKVLSNYEEDCENGWAEKYWEAPFYNTTTKYIKIISVEIEYMDGSEYTISDSEAISSVVGDGKHINSWLRDDPGDNYLRE